MKSKLARNLCLICTTVVLTSVLSGCKSNSKVADSNVETKVIKFVTPWKTDNGSGKVVNDLMTQYKKLHPEVTFETEALAQNTDVTQKIQLLAASNDLPEMFTYEAGAPLGLLIKSGVVLNTEKTLTDMKLIDNVNPGAIDNLKQLSPDGNLYALPLEMNIEGIWYNKKIFTDNNVEIPKTWDDLLKIADTFQAKNIQSFAVAGKEKWPITRYINMLAMRKFGPDVMSQVASGKISATNPDFVQCVKTVQDMAIKGYFGKGVNTIDYSTNTAAFFNGKVAMYYTGSWDLSAFNDPKQNLLGADGMGYFNFPTLAGGVGKSDEYSINCGMILAFAKGKFDKPTSEWFKFLCTKFGDQAMSVDGIISGFKVKNSQAKVPTYTKLMMDEQSKIKGAGPWFEAKFDSKTSDAAWNNAQMLVIKAITPEIFCKNLDDSIKSNMTK